MAKSTTIKRDADLLQRAVDNLYNEKTTTIEIFDMVPFFDLNTQMRYISDMHREKAHPIHLRHAVAEAWMKVYCSKALSLIAMVQSGTPFTKALAQASIWVVDCPAEVNAEAIPRVAKAIVHLLDLDDQTEDMVVEFLCK